MNDPVPAITEAAATGETAVIFNDIRRVLGVDVVNLIWRHLATISGALPWAWATLRPLYLDGTIGAEAAALRSELKLPKDLVPFPPDLLAGAGLSEEAISTIRLILAAYDRTNARALVALSALLSWLDKEAPLPAGYRRLPVAMCENQNRGSPCRLCRPSVNCRLRLPNSC
jgi:hypothetical protein